MIEQYWDGQNWLDVLMKKYQTVFFLNFIPHRRDGPAVIEYYDNGFNKKEFYYFNGIEFYPKELPFELPIDSEEKEFMFKLKYGE